MELLEAEKPANHLKYGGEGGIRTLPMVKTDREYLRAYVAKGVRDYRKAAK